MTNKKILWVTGFNKDYFNYVFKKTQSSWSLIPDDVVFLLDENIPELSFVIASFVSLLYVSVL